MSSFLQREERKWAEFLNLLANILLLIVKLPTLHTDFSPPAAYCTLLQHLLWLNAIVLELCWNKGGNNAAACEWERVAEAAAARRWSRLRLSFAHLGLNMRPFVDRVAPRANWQILFHFLLSPLNNFLKLLASPSISRVFRPSVGSTVLLVQARKSASQMKICIWSKKVFKPAADISLSCVTNCRFIE